MSLVFFCMLDSSFVSLIRSWGTIRGFLSRSYSGRYEKWYWWDQADFFIAPELKVIFWSIFEPTCCMHKLVAAKILPSPSDSLRHSFWGASLSSIIPFRFAVRLRVIGLGLQFFIPIVKHTSGKNFPMSLCLGLSLCASLSRRCVPFSVDLGFQCI